MGSGSSFQPSWLRLLVQFQPQCVRGCRVKNKMGGLNEWIWSQLALNGRPSMSSFRSLSGVKRKWLRQHGVPFGRITAELRRRTTPIGLRFGELENRAEMPQRAAFRPALDADRVEFGVGQIQVQTGKHHLALAIYEHA